MKRHFVKKSPCANQSPRLPRSQSLTPPAPLSPRFLRGAWFYSASPLDCDLSRPDVPDSHPFLTMKARLLIMPILSALALTASPVCAGDELDAVAISQVVGSRSGQGGTGIVSDNGRNAFVTSDGNGGGVIVRDRGTIYIQQTPIGVNIIDTAGRRPCPGNSERH